MSYIAQPDIGPDTANQVTQSTYQVTHTTDQVTDTTNLAYIMDESGTVTAVVPTPTPQQQFYQVHQVQHSAILYSCELYCASRIQGM